MSTISEMYTSTQFAKAVGLSVSTLYNYESNGSLIPARKTIKGRRLYSQEQLDAYLAQDYENPVLTGKDRWFYDLFFNVLWRYIGVSCRDT